MLDYSDESHAVSLIGLTESYDPFFWQVARSYSSFES
jgi:hypothetical protein